jgi:hypothetical protein
MPLIECRDCGKTFSDLAEACPNCGRPHRVAALQPKRQSSPLLKVLGVLLFLGGLYAAVHYYAFFDTTVPVPVTQVFGQTIGGGRVHNIGLLQERQNGLIISTLITLSGLVLVASADRLGKSA